MVGDRSLNFFVNDKGGTGVVLVASQQAGNKWFLFPK